MRGERTYEVWARAKRKSGTGPLELVACYHGRYWQFAVKKAAKLRKTSGEVVLRELTVTDEVVSRVRKKPAEVE